MSKQEGFSRGEELLAQVLEECLEEDLSFVPPEGEIARTHRFSEPFEEAMGKLLEEMIDASRKKGIQRHFSPRYGQWAACILVFCVCGLLFYRVSGRKGGFDVSDNSAAMESAVEEDAFEPKSDEGGSMAAGVTAESADAQASPQDAPEEEPTENTAPKEKIWCNMTVCFAEEQEVPEKLEDVTALVNCPVLDDDNPILVLTIGNTGKEDIRYLDRYDLEVWLEDGWYQIPSGSGENGQWHTLEAGMAVDEEIDLSEYRIDHDAGQYRLVAHTDQGAIGVKFTFEEVFAEIMGESETE